MSVIGTFTRANDGGWSGWIRTLSINVKVRLVPNDNRDNETAPAFLLFFGRARIGEAWDARTVGENPKEYLRVKFDDPSLIAPMSAALFPSEDRGVAQLVWSRRSNDRER
jgi:uncharacterized protein (DUF736 family)